jgi:peptidoglycan/xylan/chitin deacetylase (PgdA/CDA1 family)
VKGAAVTADRLRAPRPGVVVLIYHRVGGGSGRELDLPTGLFDEQMAALAATQRVVTLGDALGPLTTPDPDETESRVVVPFDDGPADFVEVAVPILERHGIPVTLYAATAFIEDRLEFPDEGRPVSWSALADACATGLVDVGSHTHRHLLLDRLPAAEVADEIDRSVDLIGERLGRAPQDFAYPKALAGSAAAEAVVRDRFRSAALAGTRPNVYGRTDPYRLARSPIQASDGMAWFERKIAGGMALEDTLRQLLNRRRYAAATT